MDLLNPLYALACFALALGTSFLLARRFGAPDAVARFATIDGLRGYLAFAVFVHHGSVWFFWLRTGVWTTPPSTFYAHLGDASVALFFMITGFLFFSRILSTEVDWTRLYVSRVLRLTPLFWFAVAVLLVVVGISTHWQLRVSPADLAKSIVKWLLFFSTDVNGFTATGRITAGVTWTLPYEWTFYALLPLAAVMAGRRPRWPVLLVAAFGIAYFMILKLQFVFMTAFLGGLAAALLARTPRFKAIAEARMSSVLAATCLLAAFSHEGSAFDALPLLLLTTCFGLVANGTDFFGALRAGTSRFLGEITYGMYLLHGPLLFIVFMLVLGKERGQALDPASHWAVILACSVLLVCVSFAAYRSIERPSLAATDRVTQLLKAILWRNRSTAPEVDPTIVARL